MEDSNVTEKTLLEKIRDLLERKQENYDLAFCVGKEKKIVGAVKIILKASSSFLEREFEEKWEVAGIEKRGGIPLIPLPDFEPMAFELFVKLTSLDTWSLEILKEFNLPPNQVLNLLSICQSFKMKTAEENLKKLAPIILQSFSTYKDTDDFLQLSQTNLKYVLGSDDIGIEELDVFHAAIRCFMGEISVQADKVQPTDKLIRKVLGDCLFEIRFPLMTCAEFTEARKSKEIFTTEEAVGIYGLIGSTANTNIKRLKFDLKKLPFKTMPRNKVQTSESNLNSETYNSESLIPPGISRICLTRGLESATNLPIFGDDSRKIRWGENINGFPLRQKHAAVAVGNSIYSFGGDNISCQPKYSLYVLDVFVLNVNEQKKRWEELLVENSEVMPTRRSGHSAVAHKEFVLIFGGEDTKEWKSLNSTYRFNTKTLKWDKPKVTGNIPCARRDHSAVLFRNKMFIYGGEGDEVTNDLYSLDLENFCWSTIETKGIPPSIREGNSATVLNDRFILIFGGQDSGLTSGIPRVWKTVVNTVVHAGRMYIFGGNGENSSDHLNDIFSYDPETFEWTEVTTNGEAPRHSAGCVALNDQVFIIGGFNRNEWHLRDTCVLQM